MRTSLRTSVRSLSLASSRDRTRRYVSWHGRIGAKAFEARRGAGRIVVFVQLLRVASDLHWPTKQGCWLRPATVLEFSLVDAFTPLWTNTASCGRSAAFPPSFASGTYERPARLFPV